MFNCRYCNKECKNENSLRNHERLCKLNPNHQENPATGKPAWNSGLTSKSDSRIISGDTLSKHIIIGIEKSKAAGTYTCTGRGSSEEAEQARKAKISKSLTGVGGGKRHGSGRGKKGWYKGFFCDSTYELVYIIYNLDHNITFKRCDRVYLYEYKNTIHKYYPDFELADGSLVETKGYHTEVVDIKAASVTDRPIKVLYEKDLKYAFDWVKQNYQFTQLSDLYE